MLHVRLIWLRRPSPVALQPLRTVWNFAHILRARATGRALAREHRRQGAKSALEVLSTVRRTQFAANTAESTDSAACS
jgi:hypothetical protein